ncbi:hypothetical protein N8K70_15565 [Microbacterium betulae]|uniref:Uncharacterized protein n=1 Tax=Microbacterium betulae TaxID=2981139 RepID=A0AA97FFW2_9MICO|nr:hypothetical protein [Microbacterium sp. AB]WOF22791.1 hypothetical protein N8K70_15565 [Microbacterium sp. AB]
MSTHPSRTAHPHAAGAGNDVAAESGVAADALHAGRSGSASGDEADTVEAPRPRDESGTTGDPPDAPVSWADGDLLLRAAAAYAAIADAAARRGRALTDGRQRVLWQGNTPLAADDPQFRRRIGENAGAARVAVAAVSDLFAAVRAGAAEERDAVETVVGVAGLARTLATAAFETLGASSTLHEHGFDALWRSVHEWDARVDLPALHLRAGSGA